MRHTMSCSGDGLLCNGARHKVALSGTRNVGHTSGPVPQNAGNPKGPRSPVTAAQTESQGHATAHGASLQSLRGNRHSQRDFSNIWQQVGHPLPLFLDLQVNRKAEGVERTAQANGNPNLTASPINFFHLQEDLETI